jgi:hypothetical protein
MELPGRLFLFSNCDVEILQCFIKVVKLEVKETPEKEETWLQLFFAAALDGDI